jgi:signal transduction histidine kinase
VVNVFAVTARHKGLDLRHSIDAAIPPLLLFDPVRVRQVLANLVSNAIKFTSRGEVRVSARLVSREGGEAVVQLDVNDTGIGMTLEEQQRVFEGFNQANKEISGRYGGSGLGLWIARRLAELMGGSIGMRSQPGSGTQMQVTLPMKVTRVRAACHGPSNADACWSWMTTPSTSWRCSSSSTFSVTPRRAPKAHTRRSRNSRRDSSPRCSWTATCPA